MCLCVIPRWTDGIREESPGQIEQKINKRMSITPKPRKSSKNKSLKKSALVDVLSVLMHMLMVIVLMLALMRVQMLMFQVAMAVHVAMY